jgi:hypothetical protein
MADTLLRFPDLRSSKTTVASDSPHLQTCVVCGASYDGDQCWACLERDEDVKEALSIFGWVGGLGVGGLILATAAYEPLQSNPVMTSLLVLGLFLIPMFVVVYLLNVSYPYGLTMKLVLVFAASAIFFIDAFYFFNGALDEHPVMRVDAVVADKYVTTGKGAHADLVVSFRWNENPIETAVAVSRNAFLAAKPGDSATLEIHPGAFSTPWIGEGLMSGGDDVITLRSR